MTIGRINAWESLHVLPTSDVLFLTAGVFEIDDETVSWFADYSGRSVSATALVSLVWHAVDVLSLDSECDHDLILWLTAGREEFYVQAVDALLKRLAVDAYVSSFPTSPVTSAETEQKIQ